MTSGMFNASMALINVLVVAFGTYLAIKNLKKITHSRAIDFVLDAESKIDPLRHGLVSAEPRVIREIYTAYDLTDLTDDQVAAFPFMQSVFSHVSRLYYLLCNRSLDLGLSEEQREELIVSWMGYLGSFRSSPAMQVMYKAAIRHGDFNTSFMTKARDVLE